MQKVAKLCHKRSFEVPIIVCTSPQVYADSLRLNLIKIIETSGAKVLEGTCFYNQYAKEIGEANGWKKLLSNSAKIVNILGGYGYETKLASMEDCVKSAEKGLVI